MGQNSSSTQTQKGISSNLKFESLQKFHNSYGQKRNQSLKTEEDEKRFNEEYTIVKRINDDYLGDCIIMKEKNMNINVCVKEQIVQSREQMREIQQTLLSNYNCYNHEEDDNFSQNSNNKKFIDENRNDTHSYHVNLISVVRVVKAKDELDFFLCSQSFRVIYALEYSELNINNYFTNENYSFNEDDIWQFLEQMTSALLFLQNQGKYHGDLRSSTIYIMPPQKCQHKKSKQIKDNDYCDCYKNHNGFKWYKIAENQLVRSVRMYEKILEIQHYLNKKKKKGILGSTTSIDNQMKGHYLAPEQIEEINCGKYQSSNDSHKADTFSLGCVILEIMAKSLKKYKMNVTIEDVFEYGHLNSDKFCKFNDEKLKNKIDTIAYSGVYSQVLMNIINSMVCVDQYKRLDFKELSLSLQRVGKFNILSNTLMLNKQSEALQQFNVTKSIQLNEFNSSIKTNPLAFKMTEQNQNMQNTQSFLDCLQYLQDQDQIRMKQALNQDLQHQKNPIQQKLDQKQLVFSNYEKNQIQDIIQVDIPDENYQIPSNFQTQNLRNNIRPTAIVKQQINYDQSLSQKNDCTSTTKDQIEKYNENDTTMNTNISRYQNILQENKNLNNIQEKVNERYNKNQFDQNQNQIKSNCTIKQIASDKDVYAIINANFQNRINNSQHKRSNSSVYMQSKDSKHQNLVEFDSNNIVSSTFSTNNQSKQVLKNSEQNLNQFYSLPIQQQNNNNYDKNILNVQNNEKLNYNSNNSTNNSQSIDQHYQSLNQINNIHAYYNSNQQQQNLMNNIDFANNNGEKQKERQLENILKQSNKIAQNQKQQLLQFINKNYNQYDNIIHSNLNMNKHLQDQTIQVEDQIKHQFPQNIISNSENQIIFPYNSLIQQSNQVYQNQNSINQTNNEVNQTKSQVKQTYSQIKDNEYKFESILSQKNLNPNDSSWRQKDSNTNQQNFSKQNIENNKRNKSVHVENNDLSFKEINISLLSNRSASSHRLPQKNQLDCIFQSHRSNNDQLQQSILNAHQKQNIKITGQQIPAFQGKQIQKQGIHDYNTSIMNDSESVIYENSVKMITPVIKKQNRSLSIKDEIDFSALDSSFKINNPNPQLTNMVLNSNSMNHYMSKGTQQDESFNNYDVQKQESTRYNMNMYQVNQINSIKIDNPQNGQNTESILDCSLVFDQRTENTSMNLNQQQLFTAGGTLQSSLGGTLPSSARNAPKRRTQSSTVNDLSNNENHNYNHNYVIQPISTQIQNLINHSIIQNPIKEQQQQHNNYTQASEKQQNQQFYQFEPIRNQKQELETVLELKESQFNQTINFSAKKLSLQSISMTPQQIESGNALATSYAPITNSIINNSQANNILSPMNKNKYLQNIEDNNKMSPNDENKQNLIRSNKSINNKSNVLIYQHYPPQNNIIVKQIKSKQDEFQQGNQNNPQNCQKEYVYEQYEDGAYYQGENLGNLRWGLGKFVYADGACYEGEWEKGQMNGYGKLFYPSGQLAYEGKWKDDKFNSRGVIFNEKPITLSSDTQICYQNLNNITEEWVKFDGEFKMDEKFGYGTFYYSNGSTFQCTFVDDMACGVGKFSSQDGSIQITGEWQQNILVNTFTTN